MGANFFIVSLPFVYPLDYFSKTKKQAGKQPNSPSNKILFDML
jgi:hypothetical protein